MAVEVIRPRKRIANTRNATADVLIFLPYSNNTGAIIGAFFRPPFTVRGASLIFLPSGGVVGAAILLVSAFWFVRRRSHFAVSQERPVNVIQDDEDGNEEDRWHGLPQYYMPEPLSCARHDYQWDVWACLDTRSSSFKVYCYGRCPEPTNPHHTDDNDPQKRLIPTIKTCPYYSA